MHFHTLGVVNIPPVEEDQEETARIKSRIEELESKVENNPDLEAAIIEVVTSKLRSKLSAFSREVFTAVEELMSPYGVDSEDYIEFIDMTEVLQETYANDKADCIRLPDGKIIRLSDRRIRRRFVILNGLVFERKSGPLRQPKRTHIARKMKALPDYPMTKLFPTLEEYARRIHGYEYDEDRHGFGYYCNPNAIWDYYMIGGGWPATFLVRDSCSETSLGGRYWNDKDTVHPAPDGYIWVSAARKKDIEWETMKEWKVQKVRKHYYDLVKMYVEGTIQPPFYYKEKDGGVYGYGTLIYRIGESEDDFCNRIRAEDTRRYPVAFCDLVSEFGWIAEEDAYIRPGQTEVTATDWGETIQQYIDDLDDEAVLVSIDYHR